MRLIDADALLHEIGDLKKSPWFNDDSYPGSHAVRKEAVEIVEDLCIKDAPTVDIVRCRDCKHWQPHEQYGYDEDNGEYHDYCRLLVPEDEYYAFRRKADDFCSYGERRGE